MAKKHSRRGKKHRPMDQSGLGNSPAIASLGPTQVVPSSAHTPPAPALSAFALIPAALAAVACIVASFFGFTSAFRPQACLPIFAVSAVVAASLLLNWAAASWSADKASPFSDLSRLPKVASQTSTDEDYASYYASLADNEEEDDMNGPRRGPSQIGISLHENYRNTQNHGRGRGRGGYPMPPGSRSSGDRAGPDGHDSGGPFLGRRGSGRGRGRSRGRGNYFGGAGFDKPLHPREAHAAPGWDGGGWDGRGGRGGYRGRGGASSRGRGRGPEMSQQRTLPFRPARGVVNTTHAASTVTAKPGLATVQTIPAAAPAKTAAQAAAVCLPSAPPTVSASKASKQPGPRENPEKIRRARRAERAVQIFREQCQKLQSEDVARKKGAQPSGLSSGSSAPCSSEVASSTISGSRIAVANTDGKKTKAVHFHAGPTQKQTAIFASTTTGAATIQTPSAGGAARTKQETGIFGSAGFRGSGPRSVGVAVAQALTMSSMKRKSDAALMGSDGDGNDSDDSSSGFVMTRTAGKRRINLSSGDLLANEILHDINEDLNTASEDADECDPVKRLHRGYMNEAIAMAQLALRTNETPVGCVLIHNGRAIAKGMNATNITRNGTRHAELMCLNALFSQWEDVSDDESCFAEDGSSDCGSAQDYDDSTKEFTEKDWEQVDPSKGHLYPYGQKLHPARVVNPDIMRECSLYVTVEPCIMCASMLRQYGIKKVYFGAANDKFGGTGGVLRIHMNSKPNVPPSPNVTYIETYVTNMLSKPKRTRTTRQFHDSATDRGTAAEASSDPDAPGGEAAPVRRASTIPIAEGSVPARDSGHGGNVEPGFDVEGGWGRDKAVFLLRQFYVQENGRAPAPRKKEGRAQRLVEQMKSENSSTVKLPPSAIGHQAELAAELDSLPLEASSPARPMEETLASAASENVCAE